MAENNKRPIAIITGASSGIGRATAKEFAARGYDLAVLARKKDLLASLIGELKEAHPHQTFIALVCDISKWPEVESAANVFGETFSHANVLVNNAGAFEYLSIEKSTPEKLDHLVDVNVKGTIYVSKAFLPYLKKSVEKKKAAKIVSVSSIAGLWGFSNMSVYTATKFAVAGFNSGLRRELKGSGIEVGTIYPGPVRSKEFPGQGEKKKLVMLPHQIAQQIYRVATSKRENYVSHPIFTLLKVVENVSPEFVDKVMKKFF